MNMEKLFDLVCHMNHSPGENYKMGKAVLNYKQQGIVLKKSVQAFIHKVGLPGEGKKIIQAFEGSTELPQLTHDVFTVTQQTQNFDLLWQSAFKGISLRKGELEWEVSDVTDGMVFELIPEGGKCKFFGVSGSTTTIKVSKYAAGLGVTWETIEGRKLYKFIDQITTARAKLYELWADIHYGLLAAGCLTNQVTWQGVAGDPVIDRDIATLNKGYTTIGEATKDSGYGDTANSLMLVYASPNLKSRLNQALRATSSDMVSGRRDNSPGSVGGQIVEHPIKASYSWNSAIPSNKALMVLPGNKIQNAVYLRELGLQEKDIASLSELKAYWTAFGATVADTDQCAELAFS